MIETSWYWVSRGKSIYTLYITHIAKPIQSQTHLEYRYIGNMVKVKGYKYIMYMM